ncbi:MAG: hypothetical protein RLY90_1075 [Pseudomonadota bacterium]
MVINRIFKYIFILFICFSGLFMVATFSQDKCGAIKDRDKKAYCQAVDTRKENFCHKISSNDLSKSCMGRVKNNSRICNTVTDEKMRKRCLMFIV